MVPTSFHQLTELTSALQGGDEEKFKLVVEANAVLSDPRRRERYDMGVDEDGLSESSGMRGGFGGGGMDPTDFADIFASFSGGGGFQFHSHGPSARGAPHGF